MIAVVIVESPRLVLVVGMLNAAAVRRLEQVNRRPRRGLVAIGLDALSISMASAILLDWPRPKSAPCWRSWTRYSI